MNSQIKHAHAVLGYLDALGLTPLDRGGGWPHMGALISDAGLQARAKYAQTVRPRILALMEAWPEATTTTLFAARLRTGELGEVLRWRGPYKLRIIEEITEALLAHEVETRDQLRHRLADINDPLRTDLRLIRGVGRKTMDYLSILSGSDGHVAVDVHLRRFAKDAGLQHLRDHEVNTAIVEAALLRDWNPGGLDAAIWRHYSS